MEAEDGGKGLHLAGPLERLISKLRSWGHGRLPQSARRRGDTDDLVQDALVAILCRIGEGNQIPEDRLLHYLQTCMENGIRDEVRRAGKGEVCNTSPDELSGHCPTPLDEAMGREQQCLYLFALLSLSESNQQLVVGRVERALSYEDLAVSAGLASAEATRSAARRAMLKLAEGIESLRSGRGRGEWAGRPVVRRSA